MTGSVAWKAITFDCYGTLVDWEAGIVAAFKTAAKKQGIPLDAPQIIAAYHEAEPAVQAGPYRTYREVLGHVAVAVAERLGWTLEPGQAGFLADSLKSWPVFSDSRPALERLRSRYQVAILSNVDDDLLAGTIERIGVEFDWTVTAQQVKSYKPATHHFLEAIRRVDGDRTSLLHAAQSLFHDLQPARQLGLSAVWVNRKGEALTAEAKPLHTVADLTELADWLGL